MSEDSIKVARSGSRELPDFQSLVQGMADGVMLLDEEARIYWANRGAWECCGLRESDLLGKRCQEVMPSQWAPCTREQGACLVFQARESGRKAQLLHGVEGKGESLRTLRTVYPLAGPSGTRWFLELFGTFAPSRIGAEQQSEALFQCMLDTATDAILAMDEEQRIILFNRAAQEMFGYQEKEVLGKSLNLLIPPQYGDHYRFVRRFLQSRMGRVMGRTVTLSALRKGGGEFPIQLSLSHLEMGGRVTFMAIIRDVSGHRLMERKLLQSERLAAVGQAVAFVAHEIRNPLMIIGAFCEQIRASVGEARALQKLDIIHEEIARLEKLVGDLGDFTRGLTLVKRPADINAVIRDVLSIMAEIYPEDRYAFRASLSPDLGEVHCDPDKLKQVFMNIIANGVEAMADGGVVTIRSRRLPRAVEVCIQDQGVGILEEDLGRIFDPFFTTRKEGSGLGLSICYKIVEAHEGEIWAASRPGAGTTFTVRIPAHWRDGEVRGRTEAP